MSITVLDPVTTGAPRELSPYTQILLDYLPRYYQTDRYSLITIDSLARELERLANFLDSHIYQSFPQNADDSIGILSIWEGLVGLPVQPPQLTVAQRQQRVIAAIRGRRVASGAEWCAAVTTFLGSGQWTHQENTPGGYQLTVLIPYDPSPGSFTTGQLSIFLRAITPAHIAVNVGYSGGFIVDVSHVDQDVLSD